jgi:hypothetical protein
MSDVLCQTLAGVFPFLFLASLFEARAVAPIYRKSIYQVSVACAAGLSLLGIAVALLGLATSGIGGFGVAAMWAIVAVTLASMAVLLLMVAVTFDDEDLTPLSPFRRFARGPFRWASHSGKHVQTGPPDS